MSRPTKRSKEPGFETALARLEEIVRTLEEGDLPLETSLRLFEEGVGLTRQCATRLEEAQRRIEVLGRGRDGAPALRPLEAADTGEAGEDPLNADDDDSDGSDDAGGDR
jgi:exodeoxyribonuclease VII small subunit